MPLSMNAASMNAGPLNTASMNSAPSSGHATACSIVWPAAWKSLVASLLLLNTALAPAAAAAAVTVPAAQAAAAPATVATPARVLIFAQSAQGQLEPLATNVLVNPQAKLRVRIESREPLTATLKLTAGSKSQTVIDGAPVPAQGSQFLPVSGGFSLAGFSGDVLVQVQLTGGTQGVQRMEWQLRVPPALNVSMPIDSAVKVHDAKAPSGTTLGVRLDAVQDRPASKLLASIALRSPDDGERPRGSAEAALFQRWSPGVILVTTPEGLGSGAVIDRARHIAVTNVHVVNGHDTVSVIFKPQNDGDIANAQAYQADVIKVDEVTDLALIHIRQMPDYVPQIKLGSLASVPVGSDVHAIGHPTGELWTYTKGIVSQVRHGYEWQTGEGEAPHHATVIQTQTPINPGNSGGPLLDDSGSLVGIVSFIRASAQGVNYAVSVDDVRALLALQTSRRLPAAAPDSRVAQNPRPKPGPAEARSGGSAGCAAPRTPVDLDKDGRPDGFAVDENCDGKADLILVDSNGDGRMDTAYGDRDGDGRTDLKAVDENGDGKADIWLLDDNGDGEADTVGRDGDGDGKPDTYRKVAG